MRKTHRLFPGIILGCLLTTVSANCGQETSGVHYLLVPQALILSVTGTHYPGITRALSTVGFQVREVSPEAYGSLARGLPLLLVIPEKEGQQLNPTLVQTILKDVEGGMPLLLDGSTPMTTELGVNGIGTRAEITQYRWGRYAEGPVRLPGLLSYPQFRASPSLQLLAFDFKHNAPLVVSGSRGQGRFIYSAIPLEPQDGMVFQYLPFLTQAIVAELHVAPTLAADNLCVYLDVGGEPKVDPSVIAGQLKSWSVREVHLGFFYGSESFLEFVPRFLAAAHQEGIAVYAWLEYPMVSQEFWDQHPSWREVAANGHPAVMDWRLHMALEDPACFQAVAELTRRLVLDYDWDGVDFAELYFEGERKIFERPRDFTPMHPTFRKMFQERYGVDPVKMFDPDSPQYGPQNPELRSELQDFRVELITQLTEKFLGILTSCQSQKPYLQTTLTFIDALRDPTVTERFGVDPSRLLALQKKFGFAVEIEDPYTVWNSSPDRYRAIGEYYRPRLQPGTPFSMDVNVVDRLPPGRPLTRPRGLELYELLANVASNVDLITLYAFSTFSADDMRLAPFVLGAQQTTMGMTEDGRVLARRQLLWQTDTRGRTVYLDGKEWPLRSDSQVLIPAGEHRVSTRPDSMPSDQSPLRIEGINGTVLSAEQSGKRVRLTYESRGRCYVMLNRTPATVLVDGAPGVAQVLSSNGRVCVVLPQGKHTVELE
ncbi:MAG: hypothetical protein P4N24_01845 [Acidobacteriota bacterium]|nr:hypothetical protein [Acidobacteriota bacterium]